MKNQDVETMENGLSTYLLSVAEMISVKGGEGDPIYVPTPPSPRL